MKTKILFFLLGIGICSFKSYAQFSFGVSPGLALNSAYFGYKVKNEFVPFVGFQFLNANFKYQDIGQKWNYSTDKFEEFTNTDEFNGGMYIPNIGLKYFLKQKEKIQPYLTLTIAKPIIKGKYKYNGKEDEDAKEIFKNTKMFGIEFGFGTEYFFDKSFSIGGEFGIRFFNIKSSNSYKNEVYNPIIDDYEEKEFKEVYKLNLNPTYSKFTLNFYF